MNKTTTTQKCYDCGSTIPGHHTALCDLASEDAVRDLPSVPGTQWWAPKTTVEITTKRADNNTYKIETYLNGVRQGATIAESYTEAIGLRNVIAENASDIADSVHAHPIPEPTV